MPQNLKTAVVGLAFAVFAIAGYQFIYKEGIWRPNQSTHNAINEAISRADRVTAQQARADLDALLTRAEKGERLDRAELERLIKATATDSASLAALWKEAETKSRGQIQAPVPQAPPASQANGTTRGPVSPPSNYSAEHQQFFRNDPFYLSHSRAQWTRIPSPEDVRAFSVDVFGMTRLSAETKDQRVEIGPKGVSHDQIQYGNFDAKDLYEPSLNFLALMGRICTSDGCGRPFPYTGNPWSICLAPGQWFEARLNLNIKGSWEATVHGLSMRFRTEYSCDNWKDGR